MDTIEFYTTRRFEDKKGNSLGVSACMVDRNKDSRGYVVSYSYLKKRRRLGIFPKTPLLVMERKRFKTLSNIYDMASDERLTVEDQRWIKNRIWEVLFLLTQQHLQALKEEEWVEQEEATIARQSYFKNASRDLPGIRAEVPVDLALCQVDKPCEAISNRKHKSLPLKTHIIHYNDYHQFTREEIADWLDNLHDKEVIDIEFKMEEA